MNGITIGQYIPGDSWLHKMDPRMKIFLSIVWMVLIFVVPNIYGMLALLGLFIIMFFTTKLPFIRVVKGLKAIIFLLLFTFILQIAYTRDGTLLTVLNFNLGLYQILMILAILVVYFLTKKYIKFKFIYFLLAFVGVFAVQLFSFNQFEFFSYHLDVYTGGLVKGSFIFIRMLLMIGITSLLTFSTMSIDINNGLHSLLSPLEKIHIPVSTFAMMLSLTLRFIPLLFDETNKIMRAQASRGVDFSEGSLKDKVNQIVSLLIPMFVISFNKAEDLANAMEARGYVVGAKRTRLDLLKLHIRDYIALGITLIFLGLIIWWAVIV